jgi:arginyl-tRNA synthetase
MMKYARNSLIIFDFEDALSFEGETGPYLQYTFVRINSIFRKLKEQQGFDECELKTLTESDQIPLEALDDREKNDFWEIVFYASQFEEEIGHSIESLEFSHLAKFSFNLCQKINSYYHKYSILYEENPDLKNVRIYTIFYVREVLDKTLQLMGIPKPERM